MKESGRRLSDRFLKLSNNKNSNSHETTAYGMYAVDDSLALRRAGRFDAICIVAQLALVDACGPTDCRKGEIVGKSMQKSSSIEIVILKFVVTIDEPLRNIIPVFNHSFYMEF